MRAPFRTPSISCKQNSLQGAFGSGYPFLVLGLLPPKGFGVRIPVGYPLLSLPDGPPKGQ
jgi:hypothetical protein